MMITPHFSEQEFACHHCGSLPGHATLMSLANALDKFRSLVDRPVVINDAFRCAQHNLEVHGVAHSQHLEGIAADVHVVGMTAREMYDAAIQIPEFGGIGVDDHKNYLHLDLRPKLGGASITRWCYGVTGAASGWYSA